MTEGARSTVDRYWRLVGVGDWGGATALMHDDFVEEWPQSGERLRGAGNWLSMITAHPTPPAITAIQTWGGGVGRTVVAVHGVPHLGGRTGSGQAGSGRHEDQS